MISIFILYANDRLEELKSTIECLLDCEGFSSCQKIICSDGESNYHPSGFELIEIQRESGLYCWANMWNASVKKCKCEKILYMDCDRILTKNSLKLIDQSIKDNFFVFPKRLYSLTRKCNINLIKEIRDNFEEHKYNLVPDHRVYSSAWNAVRKKNPMSGCVGFTKKTFYKSGGLDENYLGHGYPDTDYFEKTSRMGIEFLALDINELHLYHDYEFGIRIGQQFPRKLKLMNLWNGCYFCRKWNYDFHFELHNLAKELGVSINSMGKRPLDLQACKMLFGKNKIF